MSKELYSCNIDIDKNDINKLMSLFGKNSTYKGFVKNISSSYSLLFFEDYLIYDNGSEVKVLYDDINKVIETDTDFYFTTDSVVLYLPKRDIDYKFISFIRRTFDDIDNKIGEDVGIKEISKFHDSKVMTKVLFFLFILSIVSVLLGFITWIIVIKRLNIPDIMAIKYRWVVLFYLPIPIISTVLGFIYNNRGHDCLRNIIVGFITFFCILGFGVSAIRLENVTLEIQKEMSYLNNYKDIMKLPVVPKKGQLYFFDSNQCFANNTEEKKCIQIYSYIEDYDKFETYLFKSEYWILDKDKPEGFNSFFVDTDMKDYYLLYNKTLNEYNTIPKNKGIYKLYTIEYIPEMALLRISEFEYEVK